MYHLLIGPLDPPEPIYAPQNVLIPFKKYNNVDPDDYYENERDEKLLEEYKERKHKNENRNN